MLKPPPHLLRAAALAFAVLALDQWSKQAVLAFFRETPPPVDVAPFFNLALVFNRGMSFGLFSDADAVFAMLAVTGSIALGVLIWLWRTHDTWLAWALGPVLGGALGNIIDRIRYGAVVDFLDFHLGGYHWPAFNVADSAIVCGVALIAWRSLILPERKTM